MCVRYLIYTLSFVVRCYIKSPVTDIRKGIVHNFYSGGYLPETYTTIPGVYLILCTNSMYLTVSVTIYISGLGITVYNMPFRVIIVWSTTPGKIKNRNLHMHSLRMCTTPAVRSKKPYDEVHL